MKPFLFRVAVVALACMAAHYWILVNVRAPLPAEYWLREFALAKKHQADLMVSPKIIFSGGSSTLFGVDAAEVQRQLHRPAINFGLHAGMRLEDHLELARYAAKPGDVVVLGLEPAYYDYYTSTWTTWVLRNALAWNRPSLERLSPMERLFVYLRSSDPQISCDLVQAAFDQRFFPQAVARRLEALEPESRIIDRYLKTCGQARSFSYNLSNLDENGDLLNAKSGEELYAGQPKPLTRPESVSDYARDRLAPFLAEMKNRGVRVFFDYTPYLCQPSPGDAWKPADARFQVELGRIGGTLLEPRDALFFPDACFYHSDIHLNEEGRRQHTQMLIGALKREL